MVPVTVPGLPGTWGRGEAEAGQVRAGIINQSCPPKVTLAARSALLPSGGVATQHGPHRPASGHLTRHTGKPRAQPQREVRPGGEPPRLQKDLPSLPLLEKTGFGFLCVSATSMPFLTLKIVKVSSSDPRSHVPCGRGLLLGRRKRYSSISGHIKACLSEYKSALMPRPSPLSSVGGWGPDRKPVGASGARSDPSPAAGRWRGHIAL